MRHAVQLILWLLPTVTESVIVGALVLRQSWRDLPIFFAYLVFEIGRTLFLFIERNDQWMYFYGFWITEAIGCLIALWVIKELFENAFPRLWGLHRIGDVVFRSALLLVVIIAVLLAWASPGSGADRVIAGIFVVKRTLTFIQTGLLCSLFLSVFVSGLGWKHHVTGIAFGFGFYGTVELAAIAVRTAYGPVATGVLSWVMMIANNICVLVWAMSILARVPATAPDVGEEVEGLLEGWHDSLLQMLEK